MGTGNLRAALDQLQQQAAADRAQLQTAAGAVTSAVPSHGLKFTAGDRVIDLATGRRGEVTTAQPRVGNVQATFHVRLVDGAAIVRGGAELEADVTPAAPAAR